MATAEIEEMVPVKSESGVPWTGIGLTTLVVVGSVAAWEGGKWLYKKIFTKGEQTLTTPKTNKTTE